MSVHSKCCSVPGLRRSIAFALCTSGSALRAVFFSPFLLQSLRGEAHDGVPGTRQKKLPPQSADKDVRGLRAAAPGHVAGRGAPARAPERAGTRSPQRVEARDAELGVCMAGRGRRPGRPTPPPVRMLRPPRVIRQPRLPRQTKWRAAT